MTATCSQATMHGRATAYAWGSPWIARVFPVEVQCPAPHAMMAMPTRATMCGGPIARVQDYRSIVKACPVEAHCPEPHVMMASPLPPTMCSVAIAIALERTPAWIAKEPLEEPHCPDRLAMMAMPPLVPTHGPTRVLAWAFRLIVQAYPAEAQGPAHRAMMGMPTPVTMFTSAIAPVRES